MPFEFGTGNPQQAIGIRYPAIFFSPSIPFKTSRFIFAACVNF
jgi:hypothetical protein